MNDPNERSFKQKFDDKADEMRLKGKAKAADMGNDADEFKLKAQAKAKEMENDAKSEYEKEQKDLDKEYSHK